MNETREDRQRGVSILWRRLDVPGHDACVLWSMEESRRLAGTAVFREEGRICQLRYEVTCDTAWHTRSASVHGWIGHEPVALQIEATPDGNWLFNGAGVAEVAGLCDLDLGFTPATNLISLRRLALPVGESADVTAAYLLFPELTIERLEQRYERTGQATYAYESARFHYAAVLTVDETTGFVTDYPGLWKQE